MFLGIFKRNRDYLDIKQASRNASAKTIEENTPEERSGMASKATNIDILKFEEHYARGRQEYDNRNFETAEKEYALALKLAGNKEETSACLEALGDVYLEYGKCQNDRVCLLKACALYNGAKVRLNSQESHLKVLKRKIADVECVMLSLLGNLKDGTGVNSNQETHMYKTTLDELRSNTEKMLNDLSTNDPYDAKSGRSTPERISVEAAHTKKVISIANTLVERMKMMIQVMVEDCLSNMSAIAFPYAFIGLGSFSRHEMTPYSDIEFAALIGESYDTPENKARLAALCDYFQLKVINLGETIVPAMGVKSLNDYSKGGENWFFDSMTPRGFSFDADMPKACKFPRGLGGNELIQTPSKMANIQNLDSFGPDGLAEVLTSATFIMGDRTLYDDYINKLKEALKVDNNGQKSALKTIKEDNVKYGIPDFGSRNAGNLFHVKRELFRFPSLMIMNLGMYYGVVSKPPWEIVSELESKGILSSEIAHNIMVIWAIGNQLRLQTYCTIKAQRDNIAVKEKFQAPTTEAEMTKSGADDDATFYLDNTDIITRFYKSAVPLKNIMETFTLNQTVKGECFEENALIQALVYTRLMRCAEAVTYFEKALEETPNDMVALSNLCVVFCMMNENQKASSISAMAIEYAEKNNMDKSIILHMKYLLGCSNLYQYGDYKLANKLFQEVLENNFTNPDVNNMDHGVVLLNLAYSYQGMGNTDKSIELQHKVVALMEGKDSTTLAVAYNNLGAVYAQDKKDFKNGVKYLQMALMMRYRMFGNVPNIVIKENLYLLANTYLQFADIQRGKQYAIESYEMQKHLQKMNNVKEDLAWNLNVIGVACLKAYENEQAIEYLEEGIKIQLASPNEVQLQNCELLALLYNNLGYSYKNYGDFHSASTNYEKALELTKDSYKDHFSVYGFYPLKARILYNIGYIHLKRGQYLEAIENFQQSTELREAHMKKDTVEALDLVMSVTALTTAVALKGDLDPASDQLNHSLKLLENIPDDQKSAFLDMGKIYNKLGIVSRVLNNNERAIVYHQKALDIVRQIYGKNANHGDIAESLILLAEAQIEMDEDPAAVKDNLTSATEMLKTLHKGRPHPDLEHVNKLFSQLRN